MVAIFCPIEFQNMSTIIIQNIYKFPRDIDNLIKKRNLRELVPARKKKIHKWAITERETRPPLQYTDRMPKLVKWHDMAFGRNFCRLNGRPNKITTVRITQTIDERVVRFAKFFSSNARDSMWRGKRIEQLPITNVLPAVRAFLFPIKRRRHRCYTTMISNYRNNMAFITFAYVYWCWFAIRKEKNTFEHVESTSEDWTHLRMIFVHS